MDTSSPVAAPTPFAVALSRPECLYPKLTPSQMARMSAHGQRRATTRGEVLIDVGDRIVPCFVVVAGEAQALQVSNGLEDVVVVGGGNSAGQAAVFLAQTTRRVHLLVRRDGLTETMSRYLIRRIEETPSIVLRTCTEIVGLEGNGRLERIRWRDDRTGDIEAHHVRHIFLMTRAVPSAGLLGCAIV